jgi:hypothetical protein
MNPASMLGNTTSDTCERVITDAKLAACWENTCAASTATPPYLDALELRHIFQGQRVQVKVQDQGLKGGGGGRRGRDGWEGGGQEYVGAGSTAT